MFRTKAMACGDETKIEEKVLITTRRKYTKIKLNQNIIEATIIRRKQNTYLSTKR